MLVVIDGPEKAGKTTLCTALIAEGFQYRHFDRPPGDGPDGWLCRENMKIALRDIARAAQGVDIVWDRSWASDWVYGTLFGDGRNSLSDLKERLYRVEGQGLHIMLLGPGGVEQFGIRTPDDQPVDPQTERELYRAYAKRWDWLVVENRHSAASRDALVSSITRIAFDANTTASRATRGVSL